MVATKQSSVPKSQNTEGGKSAFFQPKLTVNAPNDAYEQEADSVADQVMRMPLSTPQYAPSFPTIQRKCAHCEQEEQVQKKGMGEEEEPIQMMPIFRKADGGGFNASPQLTSQLSSSKGGGSAMPDGTKSFMESRFGRDFSNVRIHDNSTAASMSDSIQAKAFTHGSDIYFNSGQFQPNTEGGQRLLAHELVHTVQQGGNIKRSVTGTDVSETELSTEASTPQPTSTSATSNPQRPSNCSSPIFKQHGDVLQRPQTLPCQFDAGFMSSHGVFNFRHNSFNVSSLALLFDRYKHEWYARGANASITLHGFASTEGAEAANWLLSCRRATAVKTALEAPKVDSTPGIPTSFIRAYAQGETNQFDRGDCSPNRTVTFDSAVPYHPPSPDPQPTPVPPAIPTFPSVIKLWVNAFIPNTVSGARRLSSGRFAGRTVFPSPPHPLHWNSCFETDDRGFSNTRGASSRVKTAVDIDTVTPSITSSGGSDLTFEVDCSTARTICAITPTPSISIALLPTWASLPDRIVVLINFNANDPCVTGSPNLAFRGVATINKRTREFTLIGSDTLYPAFEMYADFGAGAITIFNQPPIVDSPFALLVPGLHPLSEHKTF